MTTDVLRHVKPAVLALAPYTLAARQAPVKINQNENPEDVPEAFKRRVLEEALRRPWNRYPDFDPRELCAVLAAHAGWTPDGVLAGNGSNELIEALLLATVGAGTPVVIPEPTFTLYAMLVTMLGGAPVRVPLDADLAYDVAAITDARERTHAPLTILCSPNNPTGGSVSPDAVEALCRASSGLVCVDEAYHEFSGQSVVPLLAAHPNLVVLRTFSKAMAMAGLRVGYLLAHPALVREVDKARLPYNLNVVSQIAARVAIEDGAALRAGVARIVAERERLQRALAGMDAVRAYPSRANFILLELRWHDPRAVFEDLYARGILVRDVSAYPRLSRCLRVSVGTAAENDRFLAALREVTA
jgi:histidinol-phosphate aminotransferase